MAISKDRTGGTIMKSEGKAWLEIQYTFSCIFPVYSYMVGVVKLLFSSHQLNLEQSYTHCVICNVWTLTQCLPNPLECFRNIVCFSH